jgi:hypothetical protein
MPMYLVEEAGYGNGSAARIVTLTNELSNSPTFTDTDIPVDPYGFPPPADQPGAPGSAATNDTTFSHADWRMINGQGMLVSAQNVGVPDDGFSTSRVRWYEFNTDNTPSLVQQGTINPGPGVSTYYGAPALDINGDIGITYMESSLNEFVSMYVAGRQVDDPLGTMGAGTDVAPGQFTDSEFFRTGDYGGMSVDPTDGLTFWAAHEYAGTNPVYNTALASFTVQHAQDQDFYSFAATSNQSFTVTLGVPGSSGGAQFVNTLSPTIAVYDPFGNIVASGTTSLSFMASTTGTYAVAVAGANNTQGEYTLQVQDPVVASSSAVVAPPAGKSQAPVLPSGTAGGSRLAVPVLVGAARPASPNLLATSRGIVQPLSVAAGDAMGPSATSALASGTRGTGFARDAGAGTLNVVYHPALPAQGNAASPGLIDLVLSQDSHAATSNGGSPDLITTLSEDILFGKKNKAR